MLLSKRSLVGLVAITSILAGCVTTTAAESGSEPDGAAGAGGSDPASPAGSAGPARTLSFARPQPYAAPRAVAVMRTTDFDGDGHLDIAVVGLLGSVGLMRNAGDGTFEEIVWQGMPTNGVGNTVLAVGDLNGDGLGDLVFTPPARDSATGGIYFILGSADGKLSPFVKLRQFYTSYPVAPIEVADLNADGIPDILGCGRSSVTVTPLTSAMSAGSSITKNTDAQRQCAVGDFNGDGRMDLVTYESGNTIGVSLTDASGERPTLSTLYPSKKESLSQTGLFTADVNGDGRADVVALFTGNMLVYLANADGTLADPILSEGKLDTNGYRDEGTYAKFADVNGDGKLDALMVHGGNADDNVVEIMLGDGAGKFTQASVDLGLLGGGPASDIAVGDFDGDGLPDLAVAYGERNYVLRNTSR